ncbi:cytochrome oxidase assembly [Segniliparus rotundus DSM 44985]|uniref:Cytochrome oxidase assembly n=1 Tax=Segniliparus rotundus (strain ATCC BAA-972 / CDC 1076 / CIP 108378 / DSM 44985 / JCM 13578) TaxID=640132 RepID=D6Z999_SEGRD|nr:COX15/CtaA family protein [Segniliparus rotundus]ADG98529.1 cytochrome oxidase assembly [Segniliparus rotundus DSM 44985]
MTPAPTGRLASWRPSLQQQWLAALACLVTQGLITVTGAIVRVTSSGLGCPTWPTCFPDSMTPRADALVPWQHQAIEFGNRTLTGLVSLAAILVAVLVTLARRKRPVLVLGWAMIGGTLAQAVIGGITVLAGLKWWTVAIHLVASMVMIWFATLLVARVREPDDDLPAGRADQRLRTSAAVSGALLALVLVAGTLVTGAGPHAGDKSTTRPVARLDVPIPELARWHSALVLCYLVSLAALSWFARSANPPTRRAARIAAGLALAQGALGEAQYWQGVPSLLVVLHVGGAVLVASATAFVWARTTTRPTLRADTAPPGVVTAAARAR